MTDEEKEQKPKTVGKRIVEALTISATVVITLGGVIGVLWGGYTYLFPAKPFDVQLTSGPFDQPPIVLSTVDHVRDLHNPEEFDKHWAVAKSKDAELADLQDKQAEVIDLFLRGHWAYTGARVEQYNHYFIASIKNDSGITLEDVALQVEGDGYASIVGTDGATRHDPFQRTVALGQMRPAESITVSVWTDDRVLANSPVLSHKTGMQYLRLSSLWDAASLGVFVGFVLVIGVETTIYLRASKTRNQYRVYADILLGRLADSQLLVEDLRKRLKPPDAPR